MDIEGAEYKVLTGLEKAGLLCKSTPGAFQALTLEYHPANANMPNNWKIPKTFDCSDTTTVLELDSEDYVKDGKDLCEFSTVGGGAVNKR